MECPTSRGDKSVGMAMGLQTLKRQKGEADLPANRQIVYTLSKKSRTSAKMWSLTFCLGWTTLPKVGLGSISESVENINSIEVALVSSLLERSASRRGRVILH